MSDPRITVIRVEALSDLLAAIGQVNGQWIKQRAAYGGDVRPWFRGQADAGKAPLPSLFRECYDSEFSMTSTFRLKAPTFATTPETDRLDQWLFLMQHYGLPTRLLDWTESSLVAAFFAAEEAVRQPPEKKYDSPDMGIWMLHPIELNFLSTCEVFPNTWTPPGVENFRMAFHPPEEWKTGVNLYRSGVKNYDDAWVYPTAFPLAVLPSAVDRRVVVQRSCFTIHGSDTRDFEALLADTALAKDGLFVKFVISRANAISQLRGLDAVGIAHATVYPDLTGLAQELRVRFRSREVSGRPSTPVKGRD
jgi:hypothetical protein